MLKSNKKAAIFFFVAVLLNYKYIYLPVSIEIKSYFVTNNICIDDIVTKDKTFNHQVWSLFFIPEWYNKNSDTFFYGYSYNAYDKFIFSITKFYYDRYTPIRADTPVTLFNIIYNHNVIMLNSSRTRVAFFEFLTFWETALGKNFWLFVDFFRVLKIFFFEHFYFKKVYKDHTNIVFIYEKIFEPAFGFLKNNKTLTNFFFKPGFKTYSLNSDRSLYDLIFLIFLNCFWSLFGSFVFLCSMIFGVKLSNLFMFGHHRLGSSKYVFGLRELKLLFIIFVLNNGFSIYQTTYYMCIDYKTFSIYSFVFFFAIVSYSMFLILCLNILYCIFILIFYCFFRKKMHEKLLNLYTKWCFFFLFFYSYQKVFFLIFWLWVLSFKSSDWLDYIPNRPKDVKKAYQKRYFAASMVYYLSFCAWYSNYFLFFFQFVCAYFFVFIWVHCFFSLSTILKLNIYNLFHHNEIEETNIIYHDEPKKWF